MKGEGNLMACGSCHLMNGEGHPESATTSGFTVDYFVQQMNDFRSGARNVLPMSILIKTVPELKGDQNIRNLASYFSEQKLKRGKTAGGAAATKPHRHSVSVVTARPGPP